MPLIKVVNVVDDVQLGLWHITETPNDFLNNNVHLNKPYNDFISQYHSDVRQCEKLATYSLLFQITGDYSLLITHDTNGKPLVSGYNISVSHTKQYVAIIISKTKNVAIDIEYYSDRVSKIVNRFMRNDEDSSSADKQLIAWSAKETAYKLFSEQHLAYFDMQLIPFDTSTSDNLLLHNLNTNTTIKINYYLNDKYVLTYSYL